MVPLKNRDGGIAVCVMVRIIRCMVRRFPTSHVCTERAPPHISKHLPECECATTLTFPLLPISSGWRSGPTSPRELEARARAQAASRKSSMVSTISARAYTHRPCASGSCAGSEIAT
eukprot:6186234-Pleurochrysis_carterae.AAC.1